jgi:hypothetical protein
VCAANGQQGGLLVTSLDEAGCEGNLIMEILQLADYGPLVLLPGVFSNRSTDGKLVLIAPSGRGDSVGIF